MEETGTIFICMENIVPNCTHSVDYLTRLHSFGMKSFLILKIYIVKIIVRIISTQIHIQFLLVTTPKELRYEKLHHIERENKRSGHYITQFLDRVSFFLISSIFPPDKIYSCNIS